MKSTTIKRLLSLVLSGGLFLNSSLPVAAQGTTPLKVTANFEQVVTRTHRHSYGINTISMFDPAVAAPTSPLRQALEQMKPRLWRMNGNNLYLYGTYTGAFGGGQVCWVTNQQWDTAKIQAAVKELPKDFPIILCIPNWPSWMNSASGDGSLDPSKYGAFATWCAQLAEIVKSVRPPGHHNIHFEIFNEPNTVANWSTSQALYAQIYNQCATAIKAVDPGAIIGGPAIGSGAPGQQIFIQNAAANMDFYTAHVYPDKSSLKDSNNTIYQKAQSFTSAYVAQTVAYLKQASPNRNIPLIVEEYNINYNSTPALREPRQETNVGAVFDAIFNIFAVSSGADATAAWADYDSLTFGHIQPNYSFYPNGNTLLLLNSFFVGDITNSTSPDLTQLVTLACKSEKGRCLLIANENPTVTPVSINCGSAIKAGQTYTAYIIDANGFRATSFTGSALMSQVNLTNDSVTVVLLGK